jgi:hypothetical protein
MMERLTISVSLPFALSALGGCFRPASFSDRPLFAPDVGRIVTVERDSLLIRESGPFSRYRLVPADSCSVAAASEGRRVPGGMPLKIERVHGWEQLMLIGGWVPVRVTARASIPAGSSRASSRTFRLNLDDVRTHSDVAWRSHGPVDPPDTVYSNIERHLERVHPGMTDAQVIEALDLRSLNLRKEAALAPSSPVSLFVFDSPRDSGPLVAWRDVPLRNRRCSLLIWRDLAEPRNITEIEYTNSGETVAFPVSPREHGSMTAEQAVPTGKS